MKNFNNNIQSTSLKRFISFETTSLLWTALFLVLSIIFPAILAHTPQNQWITGTIVNALIFLSAWKLPLTNALLIALLPSSVALIRGLLPAPMVAVIPFIITSNFVLIFVFQFFKNFKPKMLLGNIIISSLAKFLFLYLITGFFLRTISPNLIKMFQFPQLITALAGGLIFIGIITFLNKTRKV